MAKGKVGTSGDLSQLAASLQAQAASGSFIINAASLQTDSGLSVPANLDQLLQSSLILDSTLQGFTLPVSGSAMQLVLSQSSQVLTVTGGSINALNLTEVAVTIIFSIDTNDNLQFILDMTPADWTFAQSFPTITGVLEGLIDFQSVHLIFSTQAVNSYIFDTSNDEVTLQPGLNFADSFNLDNLSIVNSFLQIADSSFTPPTIILSGNIEPPKPHSSTQCFPAMDIKANIAGTSALTFFNFLTFQLPSISLESSAFGSPNLFLNLQIVIATTTSTTIAAASNGQTLPQQTISVASATGFPDQGTLQIAIPSNTTFVSYQQIQGDIFQECSGGTGTLQTGDNVLATITLDVKAAIMKGSNLLRIYLSSNDLNLQQVFSIIPGGSTAWSALPSFLTNCLDEINFYSFSADFSIGTPSTITSLQAVMGSNPATPLNLFNIFELESFLVSWTCLNPTSSAPQNLFSFSTSFAFPFIPQLNFNVVISSDETISGSCQGTLSLSELINAFNTKGSNQITTPFDVALSDFQFMASQNNNYTFGATASSSLQLMGQEIFSVSNAQFKIGVTQSGTTNTYTASVTGILNLFGIDFSISAQIGVGSGTEDTTITVRMLNRTLGELLDMVVKLVSRDSQAVLPYPWSDLNNINMDALTLTLTINSTQHSVTVNYSDAISLGFIDISAINLSYTKNLSTGTASTQVSLDCTFFGQTYSSAGNNALAWDPINGNPPVVPDNGSTVDIRYLGIGQHISFSASTDTSTMQTLLASLENIATPPARPLVPGLPVNQTAARPLSNLPSLVFDGNSNWFIGADMTIMGAVSLGLVFNDPRLYGLIVALSGPKVKSLAGLQFEILYRKINDNIGEYYLELTLPAAMRHIQMGEVSITLPTVAISIYTNGNFEIDFGFPWNNDFSRSFGLQVFPFVGAGGFYFGVLDGATSTQVPAITNGSFDPVIVFGFGLQVGLGKSVQEGILSASVEVTVAGILQGVLGFFEPNNKAIQSDTFFNLQGVVAISGVLSGSVNFAIIQANVLVLVYADARIIYQCHEPLMLGLDVGVSVEVSVKVVFINIHFSFHASISENYTIGSSSSTPWVVNQTPPSQTSKHSNYLSTPHGPDFSASMASMSCLDSQYEMKSLTDAPTINWTTAGNAYFTTPPVLELDFVPTPVAVNPVAVTGTNSVNVVAMLYIENGILNNNPNAPFNYLMEAILAWVLKSGAIAGFSALTQANASTTTISYQQLDSLYKAIVSGASPAYSDITNFLSKNFSSVQITPYDGTNIEDKSSSVFPMLPELTVECGTINTNFATYNEIDAAYVNDITAYLQYLNIIPSNSTPASFSGNESFATMVCNDYFQIAIQAVIQAAKSALGLYNYTVVTTSSIQNQLNQLGIDTSAATTKSFGNFVYANKNFAIATATSISMTGLNVVVPGSSAVSLNGLANILTGTTTPSAQFIASLAACNLYVDQSVLKGATLALASFTYTIPDNSIATINALFGSTATVKVLTKPIPGAVENNYNPFTTLLFQGGTFTTTQEINTIALVAYQVGSTPALIIGSNLTVLSGQGENDALTVGTILNLPDIVYTVAPDTQYYIARYFGVSVSDVTGTFTAGDTVTITNISMLQDGSMNLAQLGNYLRIPSVGTLATTLEAVSILAPGALFVSPAFTYLSAAGDTPTIIAQKFDVDINGLVFNNLQTIYSTATTLVVPKATVPFSTLIQTMLTSQEPAQTFNNIAGQVSRFLLHGLLLPESNGQTIINSNGTPNTAAVTSGLYTLTGQQFNPGTGTNVTLVNTNNDSWITLQNSGSSPLTTGNIANLITSLTNTPATLSLNFSEYPLYNVVIPRYTLQHPINWSVPNQPQFILPPTTSNVTANPAIWVFPEELKKTLAKEATSLTLSLYTGSRDISGASSMISTPVAGYRWGTLLNVKIRQIKSSLSGSGSLSYIYRVDGLKTEAERHTLTALIQAYQNDSNLPSVYFLFDGNSTQSGVCSDNLLKSPDGGDEVRMIKSNLSTLTSDGNTSTLYSITSYNFTPMAASNPPSLPGMSITTEQFTSSGNDSRNSWVIVFPPITTAGNYAAYNWGDTSSYTPVTLPAVSVNATGLSFSACGQNGGEIITFGITIPNGSTNGVTLTQTITLTNNWEQYELNFTDLGVENINPTWWNDMVVPFSCAISNVQGNANAVTFAIDQVSGINIIGPKVEAGISDALNFLELIWEAALLQNGGFYLQYQNAQGTGLPGYLFSQGPEATVKLLALCPMDTTQVSSFHNAVVLQSPVDLTSNVLFVQADDLQEYHATLKPGNFGLNLSCAKPIVSNIFAITPTFSGCLVSSSGITPVENNSQWAYQYPLSGSDTKLANVWTTNASGSDAWVAWAVSSTAPAQAVAAGANKIVFWMISDTEGATITVESWQAITNGPRDNTQVITLHTTWTKYELWLNKSNPDSIISPFAFSNPSNNMTFALAVDANDFAYINDSAATIQSFYNLLTCNLNSNSAFNQSVMALPAGPVKQKGGDDNTWYFNHVFPIAQMAIPSGSQTSGFPDITKNPYNGVGQTLSMDFTFQDVFGNLASTQAISLPAQYQQVNYFDRLISLKQWPGVNASFDFSLVSGNPQLNVYMHFDVTRYLPVGEKSFNDCIKRAKKDQGLIETIYYQLMGPEVTLTLKTSMGTLDAASPSVANVAGFAGSMYQYAATIQQLTAITVTPTSNQTLQDIAGLYHITPVELALTNASVANIFGAATATNILCPTYHTVKYGDSISSICTTAQLNPTTWAAGLIAIPDILCSGTVLTISTAAPAIVYTIQPGDTLTTIAAKFSTVTPASIISNNLSLTNIFKDSIQLLLTTTSTAIPTGSASLNDIAKSWNVTVLQLAQANTTTNLNTTVSITVPNAYALPTLENSQDYLVLTISTTNTSLSDIVTQELVAIDDLYAVNQGLTGILALPQSVTLPDYPHITAYTLDANDTLQTIYDYFAANITNFTTDIFIAQIAGLSLFKTTGVILLPPTQLELTSQVTAGYSAEIFEINASFTMARGNYIDSTLPAGIKKEVSSVTTSLVAHMGTGKNATMSLKAFAKNFETAFGQNIKVAVHRDSSSQVAKTSHLWAVPLVESTVSANNTISYSIEGDSAVYFAPAPLANQQINRKKVDISTYQSGVGFTNTTKVNFNNIDLDGWAQQFLEALQQFSLPTFATPASDLNVSAFAALMYAKQQIAEAVAKSVIPVLETDASDLTLRQKAARDSLKERLLQDISTAYAVESIIQMDVNVQNSNYTTLNAPRITGKPVLNSYTIVPTTDSLQNISANAFAVPVSLSYLGVVLGNVPGLLASAALTNGAFSQISSLTSQDSVNIFNQLVVNQILNVSGIVVSTFVSGTTPLNLNPVYTPVEAAVNAVLSGAQTKQAASALTNSTNTVVPLPTDTLNSLSTALQYTTLDDFIQAISSANRLSAKTLSFSWNSYNLSVTDTLDTLASYFNAEISEIILANLLTPNLLSAQTITIQGQSYVITNGETLQALLTAIGVTVDDFAPEQNNQACIQLANYSGLLNLAAQPGVLRKQAAINLSTAEIPLVENNSYLTFLLEKGSQSTKAMNENAFVDFSYQVTGIEVESGVETLPGFEDYSTLSFVLPFVSTDNIPIEVPIPMRAVPQTPSLVSQKALLPASTVADLESLKLWSYEIEFEQYELSQDETEISFVLNQDSATATSSSTVPASIGQNDLFSAMAEFICAWPALEMDLNCLPSMSESLPLNPSVQKSMVVALESFATLASNVAEKWLTWKEDMAVLNEAKTNEYRCSIQEYSDATGNFGAHVRSLNYNVPQNAQPILEVIDDQGNLWESTDIFWTVIDCSTGTQEVVPTSSLPANFKFIEAFYSNFQNQSKTLTFKHAKKLHTRKFSLQNLNIVQNFNVWGGVAMSRNQNLINGQNTNPSFIYMTPWVKFINACNPQISSTAMIDISTLPQVNTGQSLKDYLSNLFCDLLELKKVDQPTRVHKLKVSCQYIFTVAGTNTTALTANHPIFMHPEYVFSIHDWEIKSDVNAQQSFVERMSNAINNWYVSAQPNAQLANSSAYQFNITLMTGESETKKLLNFLVQNNTSNLPKAFSRTKMPLSFYIPDDYWITPPNNQQDPYSVAGVTERVLAYYGADIYDVATAQIALSIFPDFFEGAQVSEDWTNRLSNSYSGVLASIRGWSATSGTTFEYGEPNPQSITQPPAGNAAAGAYFFRMIADQWYLTDPLTNSTVWPDGYTSNQWNNNITWTDWKPITGENAWGAILGPLQVEYSKTGGHPEFNSTAVQLTLKVLPAYNAMQYQTSTGERLAVLYAPTNTAANTGGNVDSYGVSNENNFSSLAALTTLMEVLSICYMKETDPGTKLNIAAQFKQVQEIASGIINYFKTNLLDTVDPNGPCFYTGGTYASGTFVGGGANYPFAVDVHTWGCTVLGIEKVDKWFAGNKVTVYSLWQTVKARAGYFVDGDTSKSILGVGYTDVPTGPTIKNPHEYIISAEWTFGAINMCRVIGQQYLEKSRVVADPTDIAMYAGYAASMLKDADTMMNGVRNLLLDTSRTKDNIFAYYYANRRYEIPFGWYSNRVDSLCSTAWGVMVQNDFNPFVLAGSYEKTTIDPSTYTVESWQSNVLTQVSKVNPATDMTSAGITANVQGLVRFLTINNTKNLKAPSSSICTGMPLSFYVDNANPAKAYWSLLSTVGSDVYDPTYAANENTTSFITERVSVQYGLDIYDAATMQCALAIYPDYQAGMDVAIGQIKRLLSGYSIPNQTPPATTMTDVPQSTIRGWSSQNTNGKPNTSMFYYGQNQEAIFPEDDNTNPGAYFFRSISDQYALTDPLNGGSANWSDWKPITGENAWAAFIGPLQAAYSRLGGIPSMDDDAVKLALLVLPCYQVMVSQSGGIFYGPWNMTGNTGDLIDPFQLSNENNFSSLAGLTMLQTVLKHNSDTVYLPIVNQLISGIENYLKTCLYNSTNNCFYTGGTYAASNSTPTNPVYGGTFVPGGTNFPFAVDVHTWGCSVLGVDKVDTWFGEGTAYNLWQTVKKRAGYFVNGDVTQNILGVGYTDVPAVPNPHEYIISAEWTFGAVNMCRIIGQQYLDKFNATGKQAYSTYASSMLADAASMMHGVQSLLLDTDSMDSYTQAYYYANRRYDIPFGWYANRIDSLCSTAWGVMMANNFNPFVLGGGYDSNNINQNKIVRSNNGSSKPSLELVNLVLPLNKIQGKKS